VSWYGGGADAFGAVALAIAAGTVAATASARAGTVIDHLLRIHRCVPIAHQAFLVGIGAALLE
jgi:hypothetical protein